MNPVQATLRICERCSQGRESEVLFAYLAEHPASTSALNFIHMMFQFKLVPFEAIRTVESVIAAHGDACEFIDHEDYEAFYDFCT